MLRCHSDGPRVSTLHRSLDSGSNYYLACHLHHTWLHVDYQFYWVVNFRNASSSPSLPSFPLHFVLRALTLLQPSPSQSQSDVFRLVTMSRTLLQATSPHQHHIKSQRFVPVPDVWHLNISLINCYNELSCHQTYKATHCYRCTVGSQLSITIVGTFPE